MCSQWVFRRSEAEVDLTYSFQRYKHTSLNTGLIDRMKERKWVRWNRSHGAVGGEVWSNLPIVNAFVFGGSGVTASRSSMASFGTLLRIVYLCLQLHIWATMTCAHTKATNWGLTHNRSHRHFQRTLWQDHNIFHTLHQEVPVEYPSEVQMGLIPTYLWRNGVCLESPTTSKFRINNAF